MMGNTSPPEDLQPQLLPATAEPVAEALNGQRVEVPGRDCTIGEIGLAVEVQGQDEFSPAILTQRFDHRAVSGIDVHSIRMFRWEPVSRSFAPHWSSGVNVGLEFVWAKIRRPGTYVAIGLPRDRLLQESLRAMARQRRYADSDSEQEMREITVAALAPLLEAPHHEVTSLRRSLATAEVQSTLRPLDEHPVQMRRGGYLDAFPLPGGESWAEFLNRLRDLRTPSTGLPEEVLFTPPEAIDRLDPPWPMPPQPWPPSPWPWPQPLPSWPVNWPPFPWPWPRPWFCWFASRNWPMYQHDQRHSGHASGCSRIDSATVAGLTLRRVIPLDGSVWTVPVIADGKVYVGTTYGPGGVGTLYKVDLVTGSIEGTFDTPARPGYAPGIGGSPTVVGGRLYISNIPGFVHCLDPATMTELWRIDLRMASQVQNQPVNNPSADCWSGPLVVNDRVYIGCGEGEFAAFGFVYCLDTATGRVVWLFCTDKYGTGDNAPNAIPASAAVSNPLPPWASAAGFTIVTDVPPDRRGCSVWSSCAYDPVLNRIFVGTGNSRQADDNPQPDAPYGSGVLALGATTGVFRGYYNPPASQSYRPDDTDVDVCGSPTVFERGGQRLVAIGSKSGALFLLDAATMNLVHFRQLLPYRDDDPAQPLPGVDPHAGPGENMFGVFGTPAVHYGLGRLFVGLGGYGAAIDTPTTPFMRAIHWDTLDDAWATTVGGDGVRRYVVPRPPMYTTNGECGLSSPAVVNDVVFVGTTKPGFYAMDASTGLCLWSAGSLSGHYVLGAAVSGNYVVAGAGNALRIYSL